MTHEGSNEVRLEWATQELVGQGSSEIAVTELRNAALQSSQFLLDAQSGVPHDLQVVKQAVEGRTEDLATYASLLAATIESTADGIVVVDHSGNVIINNSKFLAVWGFPVEMWQRRSSQELQAFAAVQAVEPEAYLEIIQRHRTAPETATFDVIHLKDGRIIERYGFPYRVKQECLGIGVNFRDVTDRRHVENALKISEEKYRLLWETAGDAYILASSDNIILEANAAVTAVFGYEPQELIGQDLAILQPEYLRAAHRAGIARYLATGVRKLNWRATEAVGLHKDGREIPVELAFNHLHTGGKDTFAAFIRDISERKRAEQAMAVYAAIIDSTHDAIISKTLAGIITSWNPGAERIFGYTADEAVGQSILMIIPPDRAHEEPEILARQARGERIDHLETVRVHKDGRRINVSETIAPIRDSHGTIIGISKIARDITERKQAEAEREILLAREKEAREEAETLNRVKDEFLATLSHELRTPLNAILGWSRLLSDGRLPEEDRAEALETIQRNALLQAQLIEDVLDVSRIVSGKLLIVTTAVDLSDVIQNALQTVLPAAEAKGIRLQQILDTGHSLVSGDANRLQQVVWNLLSNSIKFTPKGGRVQIRLERVNSHIEIIVTDTGIGMAPELLPHVFERFRQADSSITRKHGGLGLGLSIVRHLVEMHGGTVEAESTGAGQGSTFTIKLPLIATRTVDLQSLGTQSSSKRSGESLHCPAELQDLRVLVVDDEEDARSLVRTVLESCGAKVTTAASVQEAIEVLHSSAQDVLVSDIGMPVEDGYSLIQKVRSLPIESGGQIPAAALTAFARVEDRMKVLRAGFQIHLPKPVEPEELLAVVSSLALRPRQ